MSEEQKQETTTTEPQDNPPAQQDDSADGLRRALKKQHDDFQAQLAAATAKIEEYEKAKAADEQKKLEEEGKFKELAEKAKAEAEAERKKAERTIRELNLRQALAGIQNEFTMTGAIASCPDDADVGEWAEQFKKDNEDLFKPATIGGSSKPAQGGRSGGSLSKSLEERVADGDVEAQRELFNSIIEGVTQ